MFIRVSRAALLLLFLVLFGGCTQSLRSLSKHGINITQKPITVGCGSREIKLHYTGCGGLYIRQNQTAIIIDPFFSNQGLSSVLGGMIGFKTIKSDPEMIDYAKNRLLSSIGISEDELKNQTKAVFVAHGHYDHLLDVPYVEKHWLGDHVGVYVNESGYNTCYHAVKDTLLLHKVEPYMSHDDVIGNPILILGDNGSTIKVYPIKAAHNPHIPPGIKFFKGSVKKPIPYYNDPEARTRAGDWREGQTVSFLIDFVKDNKIQFRMFVQSSSCDYPMGMPPAKLLEQKGIDLAVLGIASYHFSKKTYPCKYLDTLKPHKVMLIHWEDFFRHYDKTPRAVRGTSVRKFFKLYSTCQPSVDADCEGSGTIYKYILPTPGVTVSVKY
jgi:ribonuclease BN (tRNA processing enzyme)